MAHIILDCDPGVDDAIGIALAALHPECTLSAVSVVGGNCPVREAAGNARSILDLAQSYNVPVLQGLDRGGRIATTRERVDTSPSLVQKLSREDEMLRSLRRLILERPGDVWLVATGPLTNVAALFLAFPEVKEQLRGLVFLGGNFFGPGNFSSVAEFNVLSDPESAQSVLTSGISVRMIPINISQGVTLSETDIEHFGRPEASMLERFLHRHLLAYKRYYKNVFGVDECPIHDPLAVAVAIDPSIVATQPLVVGIELAGELTRGQTVADLRQEAEAENSASRVQVAVDADLGRLKKLLFETLARAE